MTQAAVRAVVPLKTHFLGLPHLSFHLSRSTHSTRRPLQIPNLYTAIGDLSLHHYPFTFCRRLLDLRERADRPQPTIKSAAGRRWRRRGEPPHERAMSVRRACVRHASDACIHLGELGADRLLAAQLTRVGGARVRLICTAACALCCFTLSSPADCELVVACRVRCCGGTEFRPFMSCFMYVVGHLNDTIDCVYGRDSLRAIRIAGKSD